MTALYVEDKVILQLDFVKVGLGRSAERGIEA